MERKVCKYCKTSMEDFLNTGLLGCPECYDTFRAELKKYLKTIQKGTFHTGKEPSIGATDRELVLKKSALAEQKEAALLRGEFTLARSLGKEIAIIEETLKSRGIL